ncbi:hypothetical protein E2K99_13780 [Herbaspirillum huttiense]|uniref:hypothetical protein n=1 Tax=Herbaspirillum huttiense TaxID=863372 RepID=UPI001066BBDA|nr:hypothetical protein [Herbaspirillum huttiense]QBP76009.1 hypothetical protein E2K99_13780 [Herbaspirillum huttiense]
MESLKEVASSIADWIKSRMVNPFYAAFLFAWLALNWRVVLALGSDVAFREKIAYIDNTLYPGAFFPWLYCFAYPLLSALLYVLLSPHIFRLLIRYWRREQLKTREGVKKDDGLELLSKEEADALQQKVYDALLQKRLVERKAIGETAEFVSEIARLKEEMDTLRKVNAQLHSDLKENSSAPEKVLVDGFTSLKEVNIPIGDRLLDALQRRGISREETEMLRAISAVGPVDGAARVIAATRHKFKDYTAAQNMLKSFRLIEETRNGWVVNEAGVELLKWLELFG